MKTVYVVNDDGHGKYDNSDVYIDNDDVYIDNDDAYIAINYNNRVNKDR